MKPQNILFDDDKENTIVKVVDFGVSAHIEPGKMMNQTTGTVFSQNFFHFNLIALVKAAFHGSGGV